MENQLLEEYKRICEEIDALGDYSNAKYSSKEYEEKNDKLINLERQRKDIFNKMVKKRNLKQKAREE